MAPRSEYFKKWHQAVKNLDPEYLRKKALRELYKTTIEWYDSTLYYQAGHCALCDNTSSGGKRLHVDHDHSCCSGKRACGKCNRGLLCGACNIRLGFLEETYNECVEIAPKEDSWTDRALRYLDKFRCKV